MYFQCILLKASELDSLNDCDPGKALACTTQRPLLTRPGKPGVARARCATGANMLRIPQIDQPQLFATQNSMSSILQESIHFKNFLCPSTKKCRKTTISVSGSKKSNSSEIYFVWTFLLQHHHQTRLVLELRLQVIIDQTPQRMKMLRTLKQKAHTLYSRLFQGTCDRSVATQQPSFTSNSLSPNPQTTTCQVWWTGFLTVPFVLLQPYTFNRHLCVLQLLP